MPPLESRFFAGTIVDESGRPLGEARMWASGVRGEAGSWSGWLQIADLGGVPPPGRYELHAFDGWRGSFTVDARAPTRVFETDLLAVEGEGAVPWPAGDDAPSPRRRAPVGTPWQGSRGIPPWKHDG